jgi:NADH-quinone oxidoreductase subunit H
MTALVIWAVIPFGCLNFDVLQFQPGDYRACFNPQQAAELTNLLQFAEVDIGILYLLAVTSIGVYGITLAGWSSNNKYSMLGGIRGSAQLISYELALGLAVVGAVMTTGTLSTQSMVYQQMENTWTVIPQLLGFTLFMICGLAELGRAPFDLVEAEQELTCGYNTEYGSMKFALFFMAEYIKIIAVSAIAVTLYLGGWSFPGLEALGAAVTGAAGATAGVVVMGLASLLVFILKVAVLLFGTIWIRATWPRIRYDRLMELGWKWLLPIGLVNVAMTAVVIVLIPDNLMLQNIVLFGLSAVLLVVLFIGLKPTRKAPPSSRLRMVKGPEFIKQGKA